MEDRDDYPPTVTYAQYVEMEKELASLKEENAKLKFRADLMAIYKQEKEDRDKILHQIKCTLYDRLTETEKLNDILKFFPTALKDLLR